MRFVTRTHKNHLHAEMPPLLHHLSINGYESVQPALNIQHSTRILYYRMESLVALADLVGKFKIVENVLYFVQKAVNNESISNSWVALNQKKLFETIALRLRI